MEKQAYERKNVCYYCHIAFDKNIIICPQCGKNVKPDTVTYHEGKGRMYGAGGRTCDYCAFCYGSADWCPLLDD